jgi:hypothetical protein
MGLGYMQEKVDLGTRARPGASLAPTCFDMAATDTARVLLGTEDGTLCLANRSDRSAATGCVGPEAQATTGIPVRLRRLTVCCLQEAGDGELRRVPRPSWPGDERAVPSFGGAGRRRLAGAERLDRLDRQAVADTGTPTRHRHPRLLGAVHAPAAR